MEVLRAHSKFTDAAAGAKLILAGGLHWKNAEI